MIRISAARAAGFAGLLLATTLGCADETPQASSTSAAPEPGVKSEKVVNPGAALPEGTVEMTAASPNGSAKVVFLDQGEGADWVWHSLYVTAGERHMGLGRYVDLGEVKWSPEGDAFSAEVKAATDSNQLTTYLLRYRVGADTYDLKTLKVETAEPSG